MTGRFSGKAWAIAAALAGAMSLAGTAEAQRGDSSTASSLTGGGNTALPSLDQDNPELNYAAGVEALKAKDFAKAEMEFREVLQRRSSDGAASFMMGLAQVGLKDFVQARKYLKVAARVNPKLPDPKGRLGWVEAQLGDVEAAYKQRQDLEKLNAKCGGTCPEAAGITQGIALIDSVLVGAAPRS